VALLYPKKNVNRNLADLAIDAAKANTLLPFLEQFGIVPSGESLQLRTVERWQSWGWRGGRAEFRNEQTARWRAETWQANPSDWSAWQPTAATSPNTPPWRAPPAKAKTTAAKASTTAARSSSPRRLGEWFPPRPAAKAIPAQPAAKATPADAKAKAKAKPVQPAPEGAPRTRLAPDGSLIIPMRPDGTLIFGENAPATAHLIFANPNAPATAFDAPSLDAPPERPKAAATASDAPSLDAPPERPKAAATASDAPSLDVEIAPATASDAPPAGPKAWNPKAAASAAETLAAVLATASEQGTHVRIVWNGTEWGVVTAEMAAELPKKAPPPKVVASRAEAARRLARGSVASDLGEPFFSMGE